MEKSFRLDSSLNDWVHHSECAQLSHKDGSMEETESPAMNFEWLLQQDWLLSIRRRVDATMAEMLKPSESLSRDAGWMDALHKMREYLSRPGKRIRPILLVLGHGLINGGAEPPSELLPFGVAAELLHGFMLIHDDIADGAEMRRGGPALHRAFGRNKRSEDLAVVLGDYVFVRALEIMLSSEMQGALPAARYYLRACQDAAVGQCLDFNLDDVPLSEVSVFEVLRVAKLKTAEPSFAAPLVAGGLLGGASTPAIQCLRRIGRHVGVAFQLRDDLLGLFGEPHLTGKPNECDLIRGKCTFPVLASYLRAPQPVRDEMDVLWSRKEAEPEHMERARDILRTYGGVEATERVIFRASRIAGESLKFFPQDNASRCRLQELIQLLVRRDS
jgi:geranylgeranyl diphosphate synthase type I